MGSERSVSGETVEMNTPDRLGDLSMHRLQEAIDHIDKALRDADEETRREIGVIRLVAGVDRKRRWYGQQIDPDDSSVTVGVVLGNAVRMIAEKDPKTAARYDRYLAQGKREYNEYLDTLGAREE